MDSHTKKDVSQETTDFPVSDTVSVFEAALARLGFLPTGDFKFGDSTFDDLFAYGKALKILWRFVNDGNPARSYLDLQLVVCDGAGNKGSYLIWGELLEAAETSCKPIDLASFKFVAVGDALTEAIIQEWRVQSAGQKRRRREM